MIIADRQPPELNISPEKIAFLIVEARAWAGKVAVVEPDPASHPSDDKDWEALEDYPEDLTGQELVHAIRALNEDEIIDVLALVWIGRGDFTGEAFDEARSLAGERHKLDSSSYLMGIPLFGDYLEEGLAALGYEFDGLAGLSG